MVISSCTKGGQYTMSEAVIATYRLPKAEQHTGNPAGFES